VFSRAREKARQASCLNNLKQIGLAWMQYTQDYDEFVPPMHTDWAFPIVGGIPQGWTLFYSARLNPYIKNWQVWRCPSDPQGQSCVPPASGNCGALNLQWVPQGGRSYASQTEVMGATTASQVALQRRHGGILPGSLATRPKSLAEFIAPAELIAIAEKQSTNGDSNICWPNNVVGWRNLTPSSATLINGNPSADGTCSPTNNSPGQIGPRHNGGSNYMFADGHAKWLKLRNTIFPKVLWCNGDASDPFCNPANMIPPACGWRD
jgi:prepilin-type processing-associated H-X9-DG protein